MSERPFLNQDTNTIRHMASVQSLVLNKLIVDTYKNLEPTNINKNLMLVRIQQSISNQLKPTLTIAKHQITTGVYGQNTSNVRNRVQNLVTK